MNITKLLTTTAFMSLLAVSSANAVVYGAHNGSFYVTQVDQGTGPGGRTYNSIGIKQEAGNLFSAKQVGVNDIVAYQYGGAGNKAYISQNGQSNRLDLSQAGSNNIANINQIGFSNNASVTQSGSNNYAYITKGKSSTGSNFTKINTSGTANSVSVMLTGYKHTANIRQYDSKSSWVDVAQGDPYLGGTANSASVLQAGGGSENNAYLRQNGSYNKAAINQYGSSNRARIIQNGSGNNVSVTQYGSKTYSITQNGNNIPPVTIVQK